MPPETRPDRLGVLFTIDRQSQPQTLFDRLYFVGRAVDDPTALNKTATADVGAMLAHGPLPIFVTWGEARKMVYPREALAAAILDPLGAHEPALVEEGRAWMARYTPYADLADKVAGQAAG